MRKLLLMLSLFGLLLPGAFPAMATDIDELTTLARYFPEDAPFFATIRTDDAYIDTLDELINRVGAQTGLLPPDFAIREQLNVLLSPDLSFEQIESWLGEAIAVGIQTPQGLLTIDGGGFGEEVDNELTFAFAVTDAAAAAAFLEQAYPAGIPQEVEGGTLYVPDPNSFAQTIIFVGEDVMIVRGQVADPLDVVPATDETLADFAGFTAAMDRLPLDEYNAVVYLDPRMFVPLLDEDPSIQEGLDLLPTTINLRNAIKALGPQSLGLTILEGRSFTVDIATNVLGPDILAQAGLEIADSPALDLSFTDTLPTDVPLMIQNTGFGETVIAAFELVETYGEFFGDLYERGELGFDEEALRFIDEGGVFVRQALQGLSGLTLEEGFGWMTGDYILYLTTVPGSGELLPIVPDLGIIIANTDATAADAYDAGLTRFFTQLGLDTVEAENGRTDLPVLAEALQEPALTLSYATTPEFHILGGLTIVEDALTGENVYSSANAYQFASEFFVEAPEILAYIDFNALFPTVETLLALANDPALEVVRVAWPLLESASITAAYDETGSGTVRAVLTLSAE